MRNNVSKFENSRLNGVARNAKIYTYTYNEVKVEISIVDFKEVFCF